MYSDYRDERKNSLSRSIFHIVNEFIGLICGPETGAVYYLHSHAYMTSVGLYMTETIYEKRASHYSAQPLWVPSRERKRKAILLTNRLKIVSPAIVVCKGS